MPCKKRCDREERIAEVQLKAYWKCFPLPNCEKQAEDVPVEDESEEVLIETVWQKISCDQKSGSDDGSELELIDEAANKSKQQEMMKNHNGRCCRIS